VSEPTIHHAAADGYPVTADNYVRGRPDYAPELVGWLRDFIGLGPGKTVIDLGAGTGKFTPRLVATGARVVAVEPVAEMRAKLVAAVSNVAALEGTAEAIPRPDASVDAVVCAQSFHWFATRAALAEIHRVLKPGGAVLSVFPSVDVFREGHIGIPFSHWFTKGSRARFYYTWALRSLGFGTWKEQTPTCRQWAVDKLAWIDTYTRYRSRREIFEAFDRFFTSELRESDYIRYRLLDRPGRELPARIAGSSVVAPVARAVFRKLAFLVILSRKAAA